MANVNPIRSREGDRRGGRSRESGGAEGFEGVAACGKGLAGLGSQQALAAPARWDRTADRRKDNAQSARLPVEGPSGVCYSC